MRGGTGLHANQAGPLFLEEGQHLSPPQLSAHDHRTIRVNAVDLKYVLRKINTNRDNFLHGRLLFPRGSWKPQLWHIAMPAGGSRPLHHEGTLHRGWPDSALQVATG
jgi:hypothetical protein